jgi:hypothetical protein
MAVTAHASVTISWNVHRSAAARTEGAASAEIARVVAVHGTHVVLRLHDGTTHEYLASPQQARTLEGLVGTAIRFRLGRSR